MATIVLAFVAGMLFCFMLMFVYAMASAADIPMPQPDPLPSDRPSIADLVIKDMSDRKELGISRYGTPLQAFNGRNALQDLYEELLDACCYVRQRIEEDNERRP